MKRSILSAMLIRLTGLFFLASIIAATPAMAREGCRVCGMYIDVYQKTAARLIDKNGEKIATCGVACLLRIVTDAGGPDVFSEIMVRDFNTGSMIAATSAGFVIGSDTVPDMLPNIIAFSGRESARAFAGQHGGEVIDFNQALLSISPMAMTSPARLKPAVIPGRGATMIGAGHMNMTMDEVALGSDYVDPADFVRRPMQMMGPKKMTSSGDMFMAGHSISDHDNIAIKIPYLHKEMKMYTMGGKGVSTSKNNGIGDIELSWRHELWKNTFYSRFLTGLAVLSLPSGDFDTEFIASPGMQLGLGAPAVTAGLLYSQRMGDFWLHSSLTYNYALENGDDYRFGDAVKAAAALHYTPNYDFLVGLEADAAEYARNEFKGAGQDNTGGFRSFVTAVAGWKFLAALGGNFTIKASYGIPVYEDMNHYKTGSMEKAQMGGGYMSSISLNFKRRFK